ncbi:hypothetical protein [Salipiger abyssi]|uniref:hypothetical protein n=1 Tax=Salipiger abyssi TaxID=1250539 RepID=UPI00405843B5
MANIDYGSYRDDGMGPLDSGLAVLFLAAFPMILLLFQGSATSAFAAVLQLSLFLMALRLIHRGQKLQNAYDSAEIARAPRIPRKILGAVLIGIMVTILAGHHFYSLLLPVGFGALASALSLAAFGIDPMTDKGDIAAVSATPRKPASHASDAVLERIDATLDGMVQDVAALGDRDLTRQIEALKTGAMGLIAALCAENPDIKQLRKPVVKFVELLRQENARLIAAWEAGDRHRARRRYLARIAVLGQAFEERARKSVTSSGRDAFELEADLLWHRMRIDLVA